jgi:hypothetical protein
LDFTNGAQAADNLARIELRAVLMKWFLVFNPLAYLKLLLLGIFIFTIGYVLAINVLIVEMDNANGSKHKIASDPEHVYSSPFQRSYVNRHE